MSCEDDCERFGDATVVDGTTVFIEATTLCCVLELGYCFRILCLRLLSGAAIIVGSAGEYSRFRSRMRCWHPANVIKGVVVAE